MNCDQFTDIYELYALGALEVTEANALSDHLAAGCENCRANLQRAIEQANLLSRAVPLVDPPEGLRRRIENLVVPVPARKRALWPMVLATAACLALMSGLLLESRAVDANRQRALVQSAEVARLERALEIVQAPGTEKLSFRGDQPRAAIEGNLYVHSKLGLALLINSMPAAPSGWFYESWLVPAQGVPRPVEAFSPDRANRAVSIVPGPVPVEALRAVAVSMEPDNSTPVKPTTLVFSADLKKSS